MLQLIDMILATIVGFLTLLTVIETFISSWLHNFYYFSFFSVVAVACFLRICICCLFLMYASVMLLVVLQ